MLVVGPKSGILRRHLLPGNVWPLEGLVKLTRRVGKYLLAFTGIGRLEERYNKSSRFGQLMAFVILANEKLVFRINPDNPSV